MTDDSVSQGEDMEVLRKRIELLAGAQLREPGRIEHAIAVQDSLRKKAGTWNGSRLIRTWGDAR